MWARIVLPCTILASGFVRTKPAYLSPQVSPAKLEAQNPLADFAPPPSLAEPSNTAPARFYLVIGASILGEAASFLSYT